MTGVDPSVLAERVAALERHLARVADQLPERPDQLFPATGESDAVILHLWQAVQLTIDLAVTWSVRAGLGAPPTYGDAFRRLAGAGLVERDLSRRLVKAVGFRNLLVHAYADLDMSRVHEAALSGPPDLRTFVSTLVEASEAR